MTPLDGQAARARYEALAADAKQCCETLTGDQATWVMVGTATCGQSAGANEVLEVFRDRIGAAGLDARIQEVGCLGHCYAEPMAILKRPGYPALCYAHLNTFVARNLVDRFLVTDEDPQLEFLLGAVEPNEMLPHLTDIPRYGLEERRLLARCGLHDPSDIRQAIARGAYAGLAQALEMRPEEVIRCLREAGLRGLGGAGFLTWLKWQACREQEDTDRTIICNADEGDPGAFMDRTLLESDPHAILEGMLIGAHTIAAETGYVYVRAEYPLAVERLRTAVADAREVGLLGPDVLGSGLAFDVQIVEGAGAFVCGESSALMRSIEGKRGVPRVRPPQSVACGLHCKPTVLNNVKSLANVGHILREGASWFAGIGTELSKGTAVFALAGKIANPGLVEVPMGTTLRQLVFDIGGGVPDGKAFKAVQLGGPSGGCLPEALLDTPIDFDALDEAGAMMGSGGLVVLDEDNCMVEAARFFLEFTQQESCGACTFCRIGTRHMLDIMERIVAGEGSLEDLDLLEELAAEVRDGSLCNLGKTAPNPVLTSLRYFRHEYEAHILQQACPAGVCEALTAYYILPDKCARGCDACVGSCPPEAIYTTRRRIKAIDQALCVKCDSCRVACPDEYSAVVKISPLAELPEAEPPDAKSGGGHGS